MTKCAQQHNIKQWLTANSQHSAIKRCSPVSEYKPHFHKDISPGWQADLRPSLSTAAPSRRAGVLRPWVWSFRLLDSHYHCSFLSASVQLCEISGSPQTAIQCIIQCMYSYRLLFRPLDHMCCVYEIVSYYRFTLNECVCARVIVCKTELREGHTHSTLNSVSSASAVASLTPLGSAVLCTCMRCVNINVNDVHTVSRCVWPHAWEHIVVIQYLCTLAWSHMGEMLLYYCTVSSHQLCVFLLHLSYCICLWFPAAAHLYMKGCVPAFLIERLFKKCPHKI